MLPVTDCVGKIANESRPVVELRMYHPPSRNYTEIIGDIAINRRAISQLATRPRNQWSSSQRMDDRGHPDGYAWYFDFNEGRPNDDPTGWPYPFVMMRALCVRGS
jgi:hypothetical protein